MLLVCRDAEPQYHPKVNNNLGLYPVGSGLLKTQTAVMSHVRYLVVENEMKGMEKLQGDRSPQQATRDPAGPKRPCHLSIFSHLSLNAASIAFQVSVLDDHHPHIIRKMEVNPRVTLRLAGHVLTNSAHRSV